MVILQMYEWYEYFEDCYSKFKDEINLKIINNVIKKYNFEDIWKQYRRMICYSDVKYDIEKINEWDNTLLDIRFEITRNLIFELLKILIKYKNLTELTLKYDTDFKEWDINIKNIKSFKILVHKRLHNCNSIVSYLSAGDCRLFFVNPFFHINDTKQQYTKSHMLKTIFNIECLLYTNSSDNIFMKNFMELLMLSLNNLIKIIWIKMNDNKQYLISFASGVEYERLIDNIKKYSINTDDINKFLIEYDYYVEAIGPIKKYQVYINYSNGRLIINDLQ